MPLRLNRNTNFIKAIKATQTKLFSSYCIQTSCYLHAGTFNKKTRKILEDNLEDMCISFILGRCGYFADLILMFKIIIICLFHDKTNRRQCDYPEA